MRQKEAVPAGVEWLEEKISAFTGSPFRRIGKGWMLITSGDVEADKGNWNTMTASWGGLGVLWRKNVAFMFIRPSRHTRAFADSASLFTLSFFDETYRPALSLCGEKSGRDIDKAAASGLTPVFFGDGAIAGSVAFKEARDIIICKKIYTHDFEPARFLDAASIEECYNGKDYHRMYIGEVVGYRIR